MAFASKNTSQNKAFDLFLLPRLSSTKFPERKSVKLLGCGPCWKKTNGPKNGSTSVKGSEGVLNDVGISL